MANGDQPDPSQLPAVDPFRQQQIQSLGQAQQPAPPPPGPPQAAPPAPAYAPQQGNSIKRLLGNFFYGGGQAMMKHVGLPTDEELQQKQFQQQLQLKQQESLEGLRKATEQQYGYTSVPLPGGDSVSVMNRDVGKVASRLIQNQANMSTVTEEMGAAIPELKGLVGQQLPKPIVDLLSRSSVANIRAASAQKRPSAASRDDRFIQLQGVDPKTWTVEDQQFVKGYSKFVDVNKVQPGVVKANIMAAPRWAALDPERQAQISVAKSIAAGPFANQTTSFNALIGHLGDLKDAVGEIKNTNYKAYNTAMNRIALETGDPKIQGLIAKIEPVRKEFESLLLNNRALYEADRQSADVILNPASSPAQLDTAMKSIAHTAAIRLGAINSTVKRVAGVDIPELLEPANGAIMSEFGAEIPGYEGSGASFSQAFKSPQGPANRKAGGLGPIYHDAKGNRIYWNGSAYVPVPKGK